MGVLTSLAIAGGLAAGIGGGVMQANAQKSAAKSNAEAQDRANMLNYAQYLQSRGFDVSSVLAELGMTDPTNGNTNTFLPGYAPAGTEQQMLKDALGYSEAIGGDPNQRLAEFQSILDSQQLPIDQGNSFIQSIYDGSLNQKRLGDFNPVARARENAAQVNADAIDLALNEERNRINAEDAAKGFVGSGSFANNRLLGATIQARQAAAGAKAGAGVANAEDIYRINSTGDELKLKSLDLAPNRVAQLTKLNMSPDMALADISRLKTQPLDFFRLGAGTPPRVQAVQTPATPSVGGIILSGLGQGLGAAANAYGNYQLANSMMDYNRMSSAGAIPSNFGALTPAQQREYAGLWSNAQQYTPDQLGFGE